MVPPGATLTLCEAFAVAFTKKEERLAINKGLYRAGRDLLLRLGYISQFHDAARRKPIPDQLRATYKVTPISRNMDPRLHQGRREVRVEALERTYAHKNTTYYVDAANYDHANNKAVATVVDHTLTERTSASVRCRNITDAEETAITLALALGYRQRRSLTVLTDSQAACCNYLQGRISQPALSVIMSVTDTGHRYLGPGNPLRNGDPVDDDDGIAKSHDEAYKRATSHEDVFAADQASAALFLNDFTRTDNWHSALVHDEPANDEQNGHPVTSRSAEKTTGLQVLKPRSAAPTTTRTPNYWDNAAEHERVDEHATLPEHEPLMDAAENGSESSHDGTDTEQAGSSSPETSSAETSRESWVVSLSEGEEQKLPDHEEDEELAELLVDDAHFPPLDVRNTPPHDTGITPRVRSHHARTPNPLQPVVNPTARQTRHRQQAPLTRPTKAFLRTRRSRLAGAGTTRAHARLRHRTGQRIRDRSYLRAPTIYIPDRPLWYRVATAMPFTSKVPKTS
ncbi:hypothetical protein MRX96_046909 [Rhipicephalus microplus]